MVPSCVRKQRGARGREGERERERNGEERRGEEKKVIGTKVVECLQKESEQYHDIVRVEDTVEDYNKLMLKTLRVMKWA